jgi:excisionase family DNA binding protein
MPLQSAAEYSGYNLPYLRRLVRNGAISGIKIGQVWLVAFPSLDEYLKNAQDTEDRRYGPRSDSDDLQRE